MELAVEEVGIHTPFEKGKPTERLGRKATGLRADLPRQLMPAGLPKEAQLGPSRSTHKVQRGSPKDLLFFPTRLWLHESDRSFAFYDIIAQLMAFSDLLVTEIFHSLQGESSLAGIPFAFIRLTGCNLRCKYCDSSYAFKGGTKMRISEVVDTIRPYKVRHVLLTGGEPLLQRQTPALIQALKNEGYLISIETHGEVSIENVVQNARIIMDFKTPSSGMCRGGFEKNLQFLKPSDEVKFVIASEEDYEWAKKWVLSKKIPTSEILFSAAIPAQDSPGRFSGISLPWLAEQILKDRLPIRMQVQLHKTIWGANQRGV